MFCLVSVFWCVWFFFFVKSLLWIFGCNVLIWLFNIFGKLVMLLIVSVGIFVFFKIVFVFLVEIILKLFVIKFVVNVVIFVLFEMLINVFLVILLFFL